MQEGRRSALQLPRHEHRRSGHPHRSRGADAFEELAERIGTGKVLVAESGILSVEDAARMRSAGADAVLVGELLVRSGDPRAAVAALRALA